MVGWLRRVAQATSTPVPKVGVYIAAAFCCVLTTFFLVVDALHLGHWVAGWMR
jgi:hypothetical protein